MTRRRTWFGLPRWVYVAALLVAIGFGYTYWPKGAPSQRVRVAVEGLRTSSVYVEPGAPGVVDPARAREVVGDRPIVVAIMNNTPPEPKDHVNGPDWALCEDIAALMPTNLVILFAVDEKEGYGSTYCDGPNFPNPAGNGWFSFGVIVEAEIGWKYRATKENFTPKIEEYVLSFDAKAAEEFTDGIPRRGPVPDELARGQIVLTLAGFALGALALFVLLRLVAVAMRRGRRSLVDRRRRRTGVNARLNRLADAVLHPGPATELDDARRQTRVAKRYVLTLREFEQAQTRTQLDRAERQIAELEREIGVGS